MNKLYKKIIPFTLLSVTTLASNAATLYVAPNGNNDNDGSIHNPFLSISYASTKAQPGDNIFIKKGIYSEHVKIQSSGINGQPITYIGESDTIIDGSNIDLSDGGDRDGLFSIIGQSYIIIDGLTIKNSKHHGIMVASENTSDTISHITIKNSTTENTDGAGIIAYGSYPFVSYQVSNIIIENNEVISPQQGRFNGNNRWHEDITVGGGIENFIVRGNHVDAKKTDEWNGGPLGIDAKDGVRDGKIYDNHVENIPSQGIYVDAGKDGAYNIEVYQNRVHNIVGYGIIVGGEEAGEADNIKIYNNIVYNTGWSGMTVDDFLRVAGPPQDKTNIHIFNNTFHNTGFEESWAGGIEAVNGTSGRIYNNIIDTKNPLSVSSSDYEINNNCTVTPDFIDAANADFRLQSNSPCLNMGATIPNLESTPVSSLVEPTPLSPQGETTKLSPTYQWKAVAGATSYTLGMENPVTETDWREYTVTSAEANCADVSQPCQYTPQETLSSGDKVAWWIKAFNANDGTDYVDLGTEFQVVSSGNN